LRILLTIPATVVSAKKILQQTEAWKELFALNHVTRSFSGFSKTWALNLKLPEKSILTMSLHASHWKRQGRFI